MVLFYMLERLHPDEVLAEVRKDKWGGGHDGAGGGGFDKGARGRASSDSRAPSSRRGSGVRLEAFINRQIVDGRRSFPSRAAPTPARGPLRFVSLKTLICPPTPPPPGLI